MGGKKEKAHKKRRKTPTRVQSTSYKRNGKGWEIQTGCKDEKKKEGGKREGGKRMNIKKKTGGQDSALLRGTRCSTERGNRSKGRQIISKKEEKKKFNMKEKKKQASNGRGKVQNSDGSCQTKEGKKKNETGRRSIWKKTKEERGDPRDKK